jgi:hypothetical protein
MTNAKPTSRRRGRKSIERPGELGKPIRPLVVRPQGFAVPDDHVAIALANVEMEALHAQAVDQARVEKLGLLLRHYELADGDRHDLALKLAIEHEPGFQVDRQIASTKMQPGSYVFPSDIVSQIGVEVLDCVFANGPSGGFGLVRVRDGEIVDPPQRRPLEWSVRRLNELLEAVRAEKKKFGLRKDLEALERLSRQKKWRPPSNHRSRSPRGEEAAWLRTLQSRLGDAKKLKRKIEALRAQLQQITQQLSK